MIKLKSLLLENINQINTPQFKHWFGNSKVINAQGKPLVVYHGTKSNFDKFSNDKIGKNFNSNLGSGFYFTELINNANSYSDFSMGKGENLIPVYLCLENPLIINSVTEFRKVVNSEKYDFKKESTEILKENGYDGIILMHNGKMNELVAFHSYQIKSAIGNNGNFDSNDDDLIKESKTSKYLSPLIKLASHYKNFKEFENDYVIKNFHALYWHLTTDENFKINKNQSPTDMSSLASGRNTEPGLMVTTHLTGWNDTFKKTRKFAALIDLSDATPNIDYNRVSRGFGHEIYIFKPEKAKVIKVMSISMAIKLQNYIYKKILPQSSEELENIYNLVHNKNVIKESTNNDRLGRCYELSAQYVIQNPESILVHGKLINPFGKGHKQLEHAWVEIGDRIIDPIMNKNWPKDVYESLFKVKVFKKYDYRETMKMLDSAEHYGPWHENTLNESIDKNKQRAILSFIQAVWKYMPKKDYYNPYQFSMWMDNDEPLQKLQLNLIKILYTNEEEGYDNFFHEYIEPTLEKLEQKRNEKLAKKINASDPLFILKSIVKNRSYISATIKLYNLLFINMVKKDMHINDERTKNVFTRLYKHAMGETAYDTRVLSGTKKLSELSQSSENRYEQLFIQRYAGFKSDKFNETVKVWRGTNSPANNVKPGDFVTFDKELAHEFASGKYQSIISAILPSKDLRVYKMEVEYSELIYWPDNHIIKKYTGTIPTFKEFWEEFH